MTNHWKVADQRVHCCCFHVALPGRFNWSQLAALQYGRKGLPRLHLATATIGNAEGGPDGSFQQLNEVWGKHRGPSVLLCFENCESDTEDHHLKVIRISNSRRFETTKTTNKQTDKQDQTSKNCWKKCMVLVALPATLPPRPIRGSSCRLDAVEALRNVRTSKKHAKPSWCVTISSKYSTTMHNFLSHCNCLCLSCIVHS